MKPIPRILTLALGALIAAGAHAQPDSYPSKPITIVVPYTPGGFNDTMARVFSRKLHAALGQPVVVENRPGAGTIVGTEFGARAAPDGYTLTVVGFPLVVNQYLYRKLAYNADRDFAPIILGAQTPNLLVVRKDSPYRSMRELVDRVKATPGKVNYATAGNGTSNHLTMEYFKSLTSTDMQQIPYKGSSPMVSDLLGGQVDVMFDNTPNVLPHLRAGKMRALAVTSPQRSPLTPEVPTVAEQGYPGFNVSVWYGLAAPAGTPQAIVTRLNAELNKALQSDDVRQVFTQQGVMPMGGSVADFKTFFQAQSRLWEKVIRDNRISAE
ncbi:tripartite tricarboxylate transporter substrate binding protein [Cupriavidus sp. 2TAF22]|uniref:tripartite tricarboxylate transporter substrate binding protein n=1 Tax=unclassified Cupriavidus TaxID=2640874 RepID=UPI003F906E3D